MVRNLDCQEVLGPPATAQALDYEEVQGGWSRGGREGTGDRRGGMGATAPFSKMREATPDGDAGRVPSMVRMPIHERVDEPGCESLQQRHWSCRSAEF
jgi:hypothetical protein